LTSSIKASLPFISLFFAAPVVSQYLFWQGAMSLKKVEVVLALLNEEKLLAKK